MQGFLCLEFSEQTSSNAIIVVCFFIYLTKSFEFGVISVYLEKQSKPYHSISRFVPENQSPHLLHVRGATRRQQIMFNTFTFFCYTLRNILFRKHFRQKLFQLIFQSLYYNSFWSLLPISKMVYYGICICNIVITIMCVLHFRCGFP